MDRAMAAGAAAPARPEGIVDKRAVLSWASYDVANTIFSMNIVSLYFSLWVVNDMGGRDGDYGLANSLSMALMFVSAPLLGALSDQTPRRMPFLIASTLGCCLVTLLLGSVGLILSLACFVVANYCYQAGIIFYDALLPSVSTEENRGKVSGLGIGLGYIGSFIGVGLGLTVLGADPSAKPLLFRLTALLFLLFAMPCFLFVRERPRRDAAGFNVEALRRAARDLRGTLERAKRYPNLTRFLIGRIFYADAANTIIAFMGIYVTNEVGFTQTGAQLLLLVGIAAALLGALGWGLVVDRVGPKRTLSTVLLLWIFTLALTACFAFLHIPNSLFWLVAISAGVALGGTWTADRPLMLRLSPPRHLGQFYGLYSMVGRFAAILGPLLWTAIVDWLGLGRPTAVASLVVMVVIACLILRPVHDRAPDWSPDERLPA